MLEVYPELLHIMKLLSSHPVDKDHLAGWRWALVVLVIILRVGIKTQCTEIGFLKVKQLQMHVC